MSSSTKRSSSSWSSLRGVLISILWLFVLQFADYQGWFSSLNGRIFNMILKYRSSGPESRASREIYVIDIDDAAYDECFQRRSPMDPERMWSLVKAIADANPKTIGVDIRTESDEYRKRIQELKQYASSIVWVSAIGSKTPHPVSFGDWLIGDRDYTTVSPQPVLGESPYALPSLRQTNWGIPLYPRDEGQNVRRFPRTVHIAATDVQGGGTVPSWASRVADTYCSPECTAESVDEVYISYAGAPLHCHKMQDLFTCSSTPKDKSGLQPKRNWLKLKDNLLGKIVLIGGTFDTSTYYQTPKGEVPGLIVNAYAVKAELDGNGLVELQQPLAWILDLLLGFLIVAICDDRVLKHLDCIHRPRFLAGTKRKKILLSTAILIAVCIGSLFVAKGRYLFGFAGEGAGVILDRMRDLWEFSEEKPKPA